MVFLHRIKLLLWLKENTRITSPVAQSLLRSHLNTRVIDQGFTRNKYRDRDRERDRDQETDTETERETRTRSERLRQRNQD